MNLRRAEHNPGSDCPPLDHLLHPVPRDTFLAEYWEQRPLYCENREFEHLLNTGEIEHLFRYADARVRVLKIEDGQSRHRKIPAIGNTPDFYAIYQAWNEGFSISVDFLHRYWPPVIELCQHIESVLHFGVAANMYFTPPSNQCFKPHYDGHEVIALQIDGTKRWNVWTRKQDPPPDRGMEMDEPPAERPLMSFTMKPGDMLYLPRGYPHQAWTTSERSLHLSLQIHTAAVHHLLRELDVAFDETDADTRRSLPAGFLDRPLAVIDLAGKWLGPSPDNRKVTAAMEKLNQRVIAQGQPVTAGYFDAHAMTDSLEIDSYVRHRNPARCIVRQDNRRAWLVFHSRVIPGPPEIFPALKHVAGQKRFRIGDLPGEISDETRLNIARRLVREGLLAPDRPR